MPLRAQNPPIVLIPLRQIAAQFKIPVYAVYRVACRLGITPETQSKTYSIPPQALPLMGSLFLSDENAQLVAESIRLLKSGVHISTVFHLVESQRELLLGGGVKTRVTTLHQKIKQGEAWFPEQTKKIPSSFKRPHATQAKWAMPISITSP